MTEGLKQHNYYANYFLHHLKDHINFDAIRSMNDDELFSLIKEIHKNGLDEWELEYVFDNTSMWNGTTIHEITELAQSAWDSENPPNPNAKRPEFVLDLTKHASLNLENIVLDMQKVAAESGMTKITNVCTKDDGESIGVTITGY